MPRKSISGLTGPQMLGLYPPFLRLMLVDDDGFRQALGLDVEGVITLDDGAVRIQRGRFFGAVRKLYASSTRKARLRDNGGISWTIRSEFQNDRAILFLKSGERVLALPGFAGLSPEADLRLQQFDLRLRDAGLPSSALARWRDILAERALKDWEVRRLDADLADTPVSLVNRLRSELTQSQGKLETIAPSNRSHYEALTGRGAGADIDDYVASVLPQVVKELLAWDPIEGPRMALLLASHSAIMPGTGLSDLPGESLIALAEWSVGFADTFSKVGMVELALASLQKESRLVDPIVQLVEQLCALDAEGPNAPIKLLMAAFVVVEAELSRTKILADWPPFRRRIAAFAQASLFERTVLGSADADHFARWALDQRGHRFYLQSLIDLRAEPRWLPEGAWSAQLRAEVLGRLFNAAGRWSENVTDPRLRELLYGESATSLPHTIEFPASFLPGPIEGAVTDMANVMPPELAATLDKSLAAETLTETSLTALVNCRGLFPLGDERVTRAIKLIRTASYRIQGHPDVEKRDALLRGLAAVASTVRSQELAGDLRVMIRRLRRDQQSPPSPLAELIICLTAAAAYEELAAWAEFIGDWALELAFAVTTEADGTSLHWELETICQIEPFLRTQVGRALAALDAFLGI